MPAKLSGIGLCRIACCYQSRVEHQPQKLLYSSTNHLQCSSFEITFKLHIRHRIGSLWYRSIILNSQMKYSMRTNQQWTKAMFAATLSSPNPLALWSIPCTLISICWSYHRQAYRSQVLERRRNHLGWAYSMCQALLGRDACAPPSYQTTRYKNFQCLISEDFLSPIVESLSIKREWMQNYELYANVAEFMHFFDNSRFKKAFPSPIPTWDQSLSCELSKAFQRPAAYKSSFFELQSTCRIRRIEFSYSVEIEWFTTVR